MSCQKYGSARARFPYSVIIRGLIIASLVPCLFPCLGRQSVVIHPLVLITPSLLHFLRHGNPESKDVSQQHVVRQVRVRAGPQGLFESIIPTHPRPRCHCDVLLTEPYRLLRRCPILDTFQDVPEARLLLFLLAFTFVSAALVGEVAQHGVEVVQRTRLQVVLHLACQLEHESDRFARSDAEIQLSLLQNTTYDNDASFHLFLSN